MNSEVWPVEMSLFGYEKAIAVYADTKKRAGHTVRPSADLRQ
jgi:hypothetical protein